MSPAQTTKGGRQVNAAGPTREEFRAFIERCIQAWRSKGETEQPIFSWDNARIHGSVQNGDWADLGITTTTHTVLPPYSPDMHSVIELSHAHVTAHMQEFIDNHPTGPQDALPNYTQVLEELFYKHITPEWAQRTTHRLFLKVLPAILSANGQYPPKSLR